MGAMLGRRVAMRPGVIAPSLAQAPVWPSASWGEVLGLSQSLSTP